MSIPKSSNTTQLSPNVIKPKLIMETSDLVKKFHRDTKHFFRYEDVFELLNQVFGSFSKYNTPMDMYDHSFLDFARFRSFTITAAATEEFMFDCEKAAYALLVQVYARATQLNFFDDKGNLHYFPYCMVGNDLCLDYFPF